MTKSVQFVALRDVRSPFEYTEAFQFSKDKPFPWLQRLCIWVLKQLHCHYQDHTYSVERFTVDVGQFVENLFKQDEALRNRFGKGGETLLIGAEDYHELMCDRALWNGQPLSFSAHYYRGYRELLGFRVVVVPTMRGKVLLPEGVI